MTDALFTDLAKIHGLSVISRTSVMQYKRTKKSVREIARDLKVDYVVEGTVTRVGDRVRISAQLIAAPADRHVWAESYERAGTNILTVQAELAQAIAEQVNVHVTPQEHARLATHPIDLEAQDLYLKGRFNWQTRDTERMLKSIEYLQPGNCQGTWLRFSLCGFGGCLRRSSLSLDRKDYETRAAKPRRGRWSWMTVWVKPTPASDACMDLWDWSAKGATHAARGGIEPELSNRAPVARRDADRPGP